MVNACTTSGMTQPSSVHSDQSQRVMDDGAMAMVEFGSAPPAVAVHGLFIAPSGGQIAVAALSVG